ncbi:MAG: T9SS type A sorting domain-containing protein [Bacteroidota bacterium]
MKTRILLIVMLAFVGLSNLLIAQTPNWEWARSGIGSGLDEGYTVATDASGNVLITGGFDSPTITFGAFTLINAGGYDIFIVKYDANGNVLWAKSAGGSSVDYGISVSTDASGNILLTGYFYSPSITFDTFTLINAGVADMFIVKYDANGNVLWAKREGGTSYDYGLSVTADVSGNILLTGWFSSPTITFGTFTLTNGGGEDIFIVKYNTSGTVLWAKKAGGTSDDVCMCISTDLNGNVLLTGNFQSSVITFDTITLVNAGGGNPDIFIAKYNDIGNVLWAKSAGGTDYDNGYSIATDASGNVLVTGFFFSTAITFGTFTFTNAGGNNPDIFIVKYDTGGTVLWAKSAGGTSYDAGYCVATDTSENLFVTGGFQSNFIIFDSDTLFYPGGDAMFIVKYSPSGTFLWATALASGGDDKNSVATDAFGNIFIGGDFAAPPFIVGSDTLQLAGTENIFIAKIGFNNIETNIKEIKSQQNILLYPNPFTTQATLTFQGIKNENQKSLSVYNLLGQEVQNIFVANAKEVIINRNNLPSGMYFYKLIDENKEVIGLGKMVAE